MGRCFGSDSSGFSILVVLTELTKWLSRDNAHVIFVGGWSHRVTWWQSDPHRYSVIVNSSQ